MGLILAGAFILAFWPDLLMYFTQESEMRQSYLSAQRAAFSGLLGIDGN